jgi:hypothetical protein
LKNNIFSFFSVDRFMAEPNNVGKRTFPKRDLWNIVGGTMEVLGEQAKANIVSGFRVTGIFPTSEERLLRRKLPY